MKTGNHTQTRLFGCLKTSNRQRNKLPSKIQTVKQAKHFLKDLWKNNESYHPEDDARQIIWNMPKEQHPTEEEAEKLNELMDQIYLLEGFDPCEYLLELDEDEERRMKLARPTEF